MQAVTWMNGTLLPTTDIRVSPMDRGFLYGDGVFETLRADAGRVHFLDRHLARLESSLEFLGIETGSAIEWPEAIDSLLRSNRLEKSMARLKIIVTRGECLGAGLPSHNAPTMLIMAEEYQAPNLAEYASGWRLITARGIRSSPLAAFKSLAYLPCLVARQEALNADADDAIIYDDRDCPAETSTASLLVKSDDVWWHPDSPQQLPGVTRVEVIRILAEEGIAVHPRNEGAAALASASAVFVTNSMIGMMGVREIDGTPIPCDNRTAQRINVRLFTHS